MSLDNKGSFLLVLISRDLIRSQGMYKIDHLNN